MADKTNLHHEWSLEIFGNKALRALCFLRWNSLNWEPVRAKYGKKREMFSDCWSCWNTASIQSQAGKEFDTSKWKGLSFYTMHVINLWDSLPKEVMKADIMHEDRKGFIKNCGGFHWDNLAQGSGCEFHVRKSLKYQKTKAGSALLWASVFQIHWQGSRLRCTGRV